MQYKFIAVSVIAIGFFSLNPASATTDCAQIENARERLACYDSQNPLVKGIDTPRITSEPIKAPTTLGQTPSASSQQIASTSSTGSAPRSAPVPRESDGGAGLFGWTDRIDLDTEIIALRRGDQQRMVFRLANGQIWIQNTTRDLPFSVGDKVNIKNGRVGGYIMRSEGGTSTRVRRIE